MNEIKFTPGQQAVVNGTVDAYAILKDKSPADRTIWRIKQLATIIEAKPSGYLFTNRFFKERLGYPDDQGFASFKNTVRFKNLFTLTPEIGSNRFSLSLNNARTTAKVEPTYKKPEAKGDETSLPAPEPSHVSASTLKHDRLLELAKNVALEKMARGLTIGEVLDGAKEYGL